MSRSAPLFPTFRSSLTLLLIVAALFAAVTAPTPSTAQEYTLDAHPRSQAITPPADVFGFELGADYHLANYQQLQQYWAILDEESDRVRIESIGTTEEGRPQLMAIITSPENHARLDRLREISGRLARARVTPDEAEALAEEGTAVVWIDGGLHATEMLGAQQLMQLVYDMASLEDDETLRFLDDIVLLAVHANPDGHDLVADWYMRNDDPEERSASGLPRLYQKYSGHDNNRDFYMAALAETENMNRVAYREWYPQIMYNHHQSGPAGTVMFSPPFRDPPNHNIHPLVLTSLEQIGGHMHSRFVREEKGGVTTRSGASYSTWWNGGLRTTPYWHNMIGLLTETIGSPTPSTVPFIPDRQLAEHDLPMPVEPGVWHFWQSMDYSQTANRAVLDFASRNKEHLLLNIYHMGRDWIERGRRDSWQTTAQEVYRAEASGVNRGDREDFERFLRTPEDRQPRGYVLPADQPDMNTTIEFLNALLRNGIEVHRAAASFQAGGERYPAGSFVVRADQAFAAQLFDMFEPQDHPNDFAYPGGPPIPPYDLTGWTLAYQMGVDFDRILDAFDGRFEKIETLQIEAAPGRIVGADAAAGFVLDPRVNDAFRVVNRVLSEGGEVFRVDGAVAVEGATLPSGAFYIPASATPRGALEPVLREIQVDAYALADRPSAAAVELRPLRIGLLDEYGGSMSSGWTRLVLENFDFDFEVVYPPRLDAGNLREDFDVLLFPDMGVGGPSRDFSRPADIEAQYGDRLGRVTDDVTIPQIEDFVRSGGVAVAWGASASLGQALGLPLRDALVGPDGEELDNEDFFIPGSLLQVELEPGRATAGMDGSTDVMFARNDVYELEPGARNVRVIGRFAQPEPLRSGWAWGQHHVAGKPAFFEADLGSGKVFLFTPEISFRAQAHENFPLIFNAMYYGVAGPIME